MGKLADHNCRLSGDDLTIAARAFKDGDTKHAMHHLSGAIADNPEDSRPLTLLDEIIAQTRDPLSLAPVDPKGAYIGMVAARAHILQHTKNYSEAFQMFLQMEQLASREMNVSFLPWAFRWLKNPDSLKALEPDRLLNLLGVILKRFPQDPMPPATCAVLAPMLEIMEEARRLHPSQALWLATGSMLLRRMNHSDRALEWVEQSIRCGGGYNACVAKAGIFRRKGDADNAVAAFREALTHQDEPKVQLDIGDIYFEHKRMGEAAAAYQTALDTNPQDPWALPSFYFVKHQLEPASGWDAKLRQYSHTHPGNDRARFLARGDKPYEKYVDYLPEPQEATINVLRQILEKSKGKLGGGSVKMKLSHIEAPSAFLAFDLQMAALGAGIKLNLEIGQIPTPDPRQTRGDKRYQAWNFPRGLFGFKGTAAEKAQKPPPLKVQHVLADVAAQPYARELWLERCAEIGRKAGADQALDLIAAMTFPPPLPSGEAAWLWLQRVQVAAALSLAFVDSGWKDSLRRKALVALFHGPVDWTVSAAILALTEIALSEERARDEVKTLFIAQFDFIPKGGFCTYQDALVCNLLRLPNLSSQERQHFTRYREQLEADH